MSVYGFCLDLESNGFYFEADKIWVIVVKDLNNPEKKLIVHPFKEDDWKTKLEEFCSGYENPLVVGHNILGYDMLVLKKVGGVDFSVGPDTLFGKPVRYFDTYYASQYTNPDEDGHGIEAHGERLGLQKIDIRGVLIEAGAMDRLDPKGHEFSFYHPLHTTYCDRDVDVNIRVFWEKTWKQFTNHYSFDSSGFLPDHFRCGTKSFFLMSCQAITGWKFNQDKAPDLVEKITSRMKEIADEVEPQLPPRKLKKAEEKNFTMPAKPFKKDGSFSSHMLNFIERHNGEMVGDKVKFFGVLYDIRPLLQLDVKMPMTLGNQDDIKDWLLEKGWKPTLWNYQRGSDGKPLRVNGKLVQTSPKIQEQQKICENLMEMEGDLIKKIVEWLSLRNRLSVLEGWLEHPRLAQDGRLPTDRTGITPTHRQKHKTVVNVPKASDKVLLGKEFRAQFICDEGRLIAAGDAAALEGRVQGHYCYRYDNGLTADELLNGDIHSKNAKAFYPEETAAFDILSESFNKDDKGFKPYRDRSKNGYYALTYGCSAKKSASTLGQPESNGELLMEAFWLANWPTAKLKENVEKFWNTTGDKKWLLGIDKRRIFTRKKSALLNSLFQSCGAIIMDYAACFMDTWLGGIKWSKDKYGYLKPHYVYKGKYVARVGYYHDELEYECDEDIAEEVAKLIERAIVKAGEHLNLKVPLAGEGKVGHSWAEVH